MCGAVVWRGLALFDHDVVVFGGRGAEFKLVLASKFTGSHLNLLLEQSREVTGGFFEVASKVRKLRPTLSVTSPSRNYEAKLGSRHS